MQSYISFRFEYQKISATCWRKALAWIWIDIYTIVTVVELVVAIAKEGNYFRLLQERKLYSSQVEKKQHDSF